MPRHLLMSLIVILSLSGCRTSPEAVVELAPAPPLTFVSLPFLSPETRAEALAPLLTHLSAVLGRPVRSLPARDYASVEDLVRRSHADMGWLAPRGEAATSLVPIARPQTMAGGLYRGVLVVAADSPITTLENLRGRTIAFVDPWSRSGFLEAAATLRTAGLDPLHDPAAVHFAGGHDRALAEVLAGRTDAAAVGEFALEGSGDASRVRILARTEPMALDPIVVRRDLAQTVGAAVAKALFSLPDDPVGKQVLDHLTRNLGIVGFEAPPTSTP